MPRLLIWLPIRIHYALCYIGTIWLISWMTCMCQCQNRGEATVIKKKNTSFALTQDPLLCHKHVYFIDSSRMLNLILTASIYFFPQWFLLALICWSLLHILVYQCSSTALEEYQILLIYLFTSHLTPPMHEGKWSMHILIITMTTGSMVHQ